MKKLIAGVVGAIAVGAVALGAINKKHGVDEEREYFLCFEGETFIKTIREIYGREHPRPEGWPKYQYEGDDFPSYLYGKDLTPTNASAQFYASRCMIYRPEGWLEERVFKTKTGDRNHSPVETVWGGEIVWIGRIPQPIE